MMPLETVPHLERADVQPETQAAADKLRQAAARAELQPTVDRLARAMSLLHQFRGVIAGAKLHLPIDLDQDYSLLVHEHVQARKEQS